MIAGARGRRGRVVALLALLGAGLLVAGCSEASGGSCRNDDDCASDLVCLDPDPSPACGIPPREGCASSSDCASGLVCHAIQDTCSPDGVGSECRPPCAGDAACGEGFRCSGSDGACIAVQCTEGTACRAFQRCDIAAIPAGAPVHARHHGCASIPCDDDGACPSGMACVNGVCQSGPGTCGELVAVP